MDASKGDLDSQGEIEEKEIYYMGTQSQARKRFNKTNNFQTNTFRSRNPYKNTFIRRQVRPPYYTPNRDRSRSNPQMSNNTRVQQSFSNQQVQQRSVIPHQLWQSALDVGVLIVYRLNQTVRKLRKY